MPFAAIGATRLLLASSILFIISILDTSVVSHAFLEFLFIGRIPGTEVIISFEAFFLGVVFFGWALATYMFALRGLAMIHDDLKQASSSQAEIEEVAL